MATQLCFSVDLFSKSEFLSLKHLSYRFVIIKNIKRKELINVEEKIKRGVFGFPPPVLNGVPDSWERVLKKASAFASSVSMDLSIVHFRLL